MGHDGVLESGGMRVRPGHGEIQPGERLSRPLRGHDRIDAFAAVHVEVGEKVFGFDGVTLFQMTAYAVRDAKFHIAAPLRTPRGDPDR